MERLTNSPIYRTIRTEKENTMTVVGNFCLISDVGFMRRKALRKSLIDLVGRMGAIDPGANYAWREDKRLLTSMFTVLGTNCNKKHAKFFLSIISAHIPEAQNVKI